MKTPVVGYQGKQLEIDFDLDRPKSSICPKCASDIIRLADGCHICGWSENQSPSEEFSISIPCTVKPPNQPERSGVIKQDLGSRFLVYIPDSDSTVTVPKLFVYPDLSQLDKNPRKNIPSSKKCSSKTTLPSKNNPRKSRRKKGEGNGSIHYRMVTKNGKQYQSAYYHYIENGKKRTKYISNKLLDRVKEAESRKLPVTDILVLLVGKDKSPRKSSDTFQDCNFPDRDRPENSGNEKVMETSVINPRKIIHPSKNCSSKQSPPSKIPPSKTRRKKGDGTGYIYRRTVTRKGIQYQESYYRYRDESGKLKSKYIPRKLIDRVEEADNSKLPVADVLLLLGGFGISRGEQSNESEIISRGERVNPPSTKKRKHGYGGGYIECKSITRNGKQYKQYWFHWEVWRDGETVTKKSRYIPKRLVPKVERMNQEKVAVSQILEVLGVKD